jgi:hypothetical protein
MQCRTGTLYTWLSSLQTLGITLLLFKLQLADTWHANVAIVKCLGATAAGNLKSNSVMRLATATVETSSDYC